MAQLGARLNGIQKVRGSNPLSSTRTLQKRDVAKSSVFLLVWSGNFVLDFDAEKLRLGGFLLQFVEGLEQPGVCSVGGGVVGAGDPLAGHAGVDTLQGEVGPLSAHWATCWLVVRMRWEEILPLYAKAACT